MLLKCHMLVTFNQAQFWPPRGHLAMSGDIFGCHPGEWVVPSGENPGLLMHPTALQRTGGPLQQRMCMREC